MRSSGSTATGAIATVLMAIAIASPASANIEATDEATGAHCPPVMVEDHVVTGGCWVHFISEEEFRIYAHVPGVGTFLLSSCEDDFYVHHNENGEGYVHLYNPSAHSGVACTRVPCDEGAPSHRNLPWPVRVQETAPGVEVLTVTYCLRPASAGEGSNAGFSCTQSIPLTTVEHGLELGFTSDQACAGLPSIEMTGHWVNSTATAELIHP